METDGEWMACQTTKLTKWQKAISDTLWRGNRVINTMPELLPMSDLYFAQLVKIVERLDKKLS